VFNDRGKYGFEEEGKSAYFLSGGKKTRNRINRLIPTTKDTGNKSNHPPSKCRSKKSQMAFSPDPIREDKVKAAKIKKQRGDYSSEEVYRKIADRLMDLFGIK
jgi:hypothetical protein